jgi:hypothetical protein
MRGTLARARHGAELGFLRGVTSRGATKALGARCLELGTRRAGWQLSIRVRSRAGEGPGDDGGSESRFERQYGGLQW